MTENLATTHEEAPLAFQLSDGCSLVLHRLRAGNQTRVPLVLLHALAMNAQMWESVAAVLQTDSPIYGLDCRGHGESGKPAGPYSTEQFANDLCEVLDQMDVKTAHIAGCSMGGTVALAFAARFAGRVSSLTVIDCTAWYGDDAAVAWEGRAQRALQNGLSSLIPFQQERWFNPAFCLSHPQAVSAAVEVFVRNDVKAYAESCRMLGSADERHGIGRYKGPVAVVVGDADYATPVSMSEDIVGRMDGAELQVLDGLRHYTPIEAPERIAICLESAMKRSIAQVN